MPELGSFTEVRALLALGRYQEALEQAEQTGTFNGTVQVLINRQGLYFAARAHEGLADTARAIAVYEKLLDANWGEAAASIPLIADAADRLEALRAPE